MRVLIITPFFPYPADSGGNTRTFNLLKGLGKEGVEVVLAVVTAENIAPEAIREFEKLLPHVKAVGVPYSNSMIHKAFYYLLAQAGLGGLCFRRIRNQLAAIAFKEGSDIVQVEYSQAARYLPRTLKPSILVYIEFRFRVSERELKLKTHPVERLKSFLSHHLMKREELSHIRRYDRIVCMSDEDLRFLGEYSGSVPGMVIDNGVDLDDYPFREPSSKPRGLYFVGWFMNQQNNIALDHFLDNIWPLLKEPKPDFVVIGKDLSRARQERLSAFGIRYVGYLKLEEMRSEVNGRILVVPLLSGSGTRLKILEALAMGNPVLSTTIGAEGIEAENGRHIIIANGNNEFATAIKRLMNEPALCKTITSNARQLVEERYGWPSVAKKLLTLYRHLHECGTDIRTRRDTPIPTP